jgi:hypothetical protein
MIKPRAGILVREKFPPLDRKRRYFRVHGVHKGWIFGSRWEEGQKEIDGMWYRIPREAWEKQEHERVREW